ncbi:glucokinase [Candidatus Nitrotoga sp. M5]|uniref:glucokinase n=1 Tax=Candidatus Nitrotoga sp. M5 TaxID=2890409 RepID=UPI001EF388D5|nr:glucokinase [Candidatus Nitrotoga sp. M5]CAH1386358.1 Glucokinase [Candidatus Nitrotoga sp. M5]
MPIEMRQLLTGDIGGTKTRLALVEVEGNHVEICRECTYVSQRYDAFELLLDDFLSSNKTVDDAAFGIAGPVRGNVVRATNLPWCIDAAALRQRFGFLRCNLLNDLEATAYGLAALDDADLLTLQAGSPGAKGNEAVIAAGTGLGEAGLYWDGLSHRPFATEGGHATFSPRNALEFALLNYLQQHHHQEGRGHVSWERAVSGMGLLDLYAFLLDYRHVSTPAWLAEEMRVTDTAAAISAAALAGSDEICVETMQLFVSLYGAEAGNLALKVMSRGGLYIGGGIAPKILPLMQAGEFLDAFLDKGRMRPVLAAMPVKVILNDRAALYGPALFAAQQREKS